MNQPPPRRHSSPDALLQRYYSLLLPWRPPLDADVREHAGCILPAACPAKIWPTSTRVVVPSRLYHSRCQAAASASMPDASARSRSPKASSPAAALASPHLIFIKKKSAELGPRTMQGGEPGREIFRARNHRSAQTSWRHISKPPTLSVLHPDLMAPLQATLVENNDGGRRDKDKT
jgi:hypothetical protein